MKHIIYRLIIICAIIGSMGASPFRPAIVMAEDTPSNQDIAIPSPTPSVQPDPSVTSTPVTSESASTANTQAQPTSSALGPVIFVPGIMGSFLDVDGCNVWPGLGEIEFTWYGSNTCAILPDKNILNLDQENQPEVKATDAYRCTSLSSSASDYTTCKWDVGTAMYSKLLQRLTEAGYTEYLSATRDDNGNKKNALERCEEAQEQGVALEQSNLYVLGYDWRQSTEVSAQALQSLINCVYSRHNKKIDLVGHSMGGLVIKQYLLRDETSATKIDSVSTFNTPYLGSVRAIDILGTGMYEMITLLQMPHNLTCNLVFTTVCVGKIAKAVSMMQSCERKKFSASLPECAELPSRLRALARSFPGAIELLPSNLYLKQFPGTLIINGTPITDNTQHWNELAKEFGNKSKQFQLSYAVGRDDTGSIVERTKNIHYLIQFSSNPSSTVSTAEKKGSAWEFKKGAGDGTVNELSLTRINHQLNYNPASTNDRKVYLFGYCNQKIDHSKIVNHDFALDRLVMFLILPNSIAHQQNTCINGNSVRLTDLQTAAVVLKTPDTNFVSSDGQWPTLTWQDNITDVKKKGYRVQISANPDMSSPVVDECTNQLQYRPTSDIWAQSMMGTYYWRVNYMPVSWKSNDPGSCRVNDPVTKWSDVRIFTNPVTEKRPQLTSPNHMYLSQTGVWPTLTWSPASTVPTTYGYRIQVFKLISSEETTLIVDECRMSPAYTALDPNQTKKYAGLYQWRVTYATQPWDTKNPSSCAKNPIEPRLWSDSRLFINDNEQLRIAAVAPADGMSTTDGGWPLLQWNNGNFQTSFGYRLQVSTNADFSNLIVDECTMDRSYKPLDNWWAQIQTGQFYWRVNYMQKPWFTGKVTQAQKLACNNISGAIDSLYWSVSRSFTNPIIPKSPQVISPADGFQSANGYWANLTWAPVNSMPASFGYRIQVSRDRFFLDPKQFVVDECRMQPVYTANLPEWTKLQTGVFYWRVNYARATWNTSDPSSCKNTPVTASLWSSVRSFYNANPADRIAAEADFLGVYSDGTVGGWTNEYWDGGNGEMDLPASLNQIVAVANGGHSLALKSNGTVIAWGCDSEYTNYGQCDIPSGLNNVKAIAAGGLHSLALKNDGTVVAWGYNQFGQTKVPSSLTSVVAIDAGIHHSLALKSDGTVVCWGSCGKMPTKLSGVVAIAGGLKFSLALKSDRTVIMWGKFDSDIAKPLPSNLSGVVAISAFNDHAMFLKADGTVVGAGFAMGGDVEPPAGLNNVVAIEAGLYHSYALKSNGQIIGWGNCLEWDNSGACTDYDAPGNGIMLNK